MIMDIRQSVAELLSIHDCVIIPGFGGFIGSYAPARIDPVTHSFHPPAKQLLFNVNLRQNDGLLANEVASSAGVGYTEACILIDTFADECRRNLRAGLAVILPEIGKLLPEEEGIIRFEQEPHVCLLPDSFGLTTFISPPVIRAQTRKMALPRAVRWAAVLALPVGLAAVIGVTQYGKISTAFSGKADLAGSLFARLSTTSSVDRKPAPVPQKTKVIPSAHVKAVAAASVPVVTSPPPAASVIRPDDRFAVIVGAFRMKENAEKLVNELKEKGVEAVIYDQSKTGLYRVTIGTGNTRAEANALLASVTAPELAGAWVLAK